MQGDDQYYENVGGTSFVRKSRQVFPRTSWGSMGIKVFDFNNDGRLDIFITDMHSDMSEPIGPEHDQIKSTMKWPESFRGTGKTSIWGNSFFLKEGPGKFREASDALGRGELLSVGSERRRPQRRRLRRRVYRGRHELSGTLHDQFGEAQRRGQRFVDAEFVLGVEPRNGGVATPLFELDASGKDKGHADAAGATGRVTVWGARGTRSAVIFDLDGDGDLDIVTNEFNAPPMVLVSNLTEKTRLRYLEVTLTGTTSNRNGLGAVVKVTAGGTTHTKVHGRQLRVSVAQPLSALLRTRCSRRRSTASRFCGHRARSRSFSRRSSSIRGSTCASSKQGYCASAWARSSGGQSGDRQ